jgi:hypothetical protein
VKELLLYTEDYDRAREEIERLGGQVRQVFTPYVLTAVVPEDAALTASSAEPPPKLDPISRMMADAWRARASKVAASGEGIPWDTPGYEPPC